MRVHVYVAVGGKNEYIKMMEQNDFKLCELCFIYSGLWTTFCTKYGTSLDSRIFTKIGVYFSNNIVIIVLIV